MTRRLSLPCGESRNWEIAYAITVHKSQGSEFPAVILPAAQVPPDCAIATCCTPA